MKFQSEIPPQKVHKQQIMSMKCNQRFVNIHIVKLNLFREYLCKLKIDIIIERLKT